MTQRIVVADDEAHILHVVTMKLKNAGYEILTAVDGEEALELCMAESPCMLITDNQMPYITGMELCHRLRENGKTLPIIMLTARGYEITPDQIQAAGISALLAKPFSPREVLEKVTELIGAAPTPAAVE